MGVPLRCKPGRLSRQLQRRRGCGPPCLVSRGNGSCSDKQTAPRKDAPAKHAPSSVSCPALPLAADAAAAASAGPAALLQASISATARAPKSTSPSWSNLPRAAMAWAYDTHAHASAAHAPCGAHCGRAAGPRDRAWWGADVVQPMP